MRLERILSEKDSERQWFMSIIPFPFSSEDGDLIFAKTLKKEMPSEKNKLSSKLSILFPAVYTFSQIDGSPAPTWRGIKLERGEEVPTNPF